MIYDKDSNPKTKETETLGKINKINGNDLVILQVRVERKHLITTIK